MSSSLMIVEFTKSSQNVCMCVGLSMLFIILFMISPLNSFMLSSIFGKVIILTLLGYTLYYKTNIICSYIISLVIYFLYLC